MLQRPIYGGIFGRGVYALATQPTITNGLDAVRFMVVDPRAGTVLSVSDVKLEAIAMARRLLYLTTPAANDARWQQAAFWPELPVEPVPQLRTISRRRRQVFERSGSRCHYCRAALALNGRWHIEHMVPKALGGDEGPGNLVAACAPCNLAKRDRTALEFFTREA
jgi:hypothetical protein